VLVRDAGDVKVEIGHDWTRVDRAELAIRSLCSIEKPRVTLGWQPRNADLRDGAHYADRCRTSRVAGGMGSPIPSGLRGCTGRGRLTSATHATMG
jgi:hypothetical protein